MQNSWGGSSDKAASSKRRSTGTPDGNSTLTTGKLNNNSGAAKNMKRRETVVKTYSLDKDVADWLEHQPQPGRLVSALVREAGMGKAYKRKKLEAVIAADEAGSIEAQAELDEIERYKETQGYKLRFKEDQYRVIRSYDRNGFVTDVIRESIRNNLDMDKIEVIDFVNNTIADFEKGYIVELDLKQEIEELKAQRTDEPEPGFVKGPVRHGEQSVGEYCPF